MQLEKTRRGPEFHQDSGYSVRETLLRIEPRVDLYIREKWRAGEESKLPVVLLHGAGMDSTGFDVPVGNTSLVDALALNGSRTFVFDFRGHGRSSRAEDGGSVTVASSVADTLEVLDFVREVTGSEKVVLIGESYGTIVAPVVAEQKPERIAGLALLGLIHSGSATPLDDFLAELREAPSGYAFTTEEEWPEVFIPSASPEVVAWHQAQFGTAYAYPVGPYLEVAKLPHTRAPERIAGRVLVITGDQDPYASEADTSGFLAAVGTRQTQHIHQNGVGHLPYVEKQALEVQKALCELIDACSAQQ
ncbi:alpha/beta fold hydrolase [Ktedonosporobacter rubrisoli]|uniref:Alpha/beta fold hydrolase n=1 Tax=Ktedonosporobacter rubrisoli TaxID=2509675 RepID=A0A4P6JJC2_KTERU|nr:alpha/beta fold hydrolase [Ktedonosporobacter rubrisoli]QBD75217.1 alpha/beta fold hydrolase [Ktedonosporobacter rubrisoli]